MDHLLPADITLETAAGILTITWSDGRVCRYPVSRLRLACPCVECRGGHEQMGHAFDPQDLSELQPAREFHAERLELVGNYALQFFWDDGHHAGIYTWEYLSRLCPSEADDA